MVLLENCLSSTGMLETARAVRHGEQRQRLEFVNSEKLHTIVFVL